MSIKREEAKELLPIVKALAEGKMIQDSIDGSKWFDTDEINLEYEGKKIKHRIKPEPEYRPFKTKEECWNEMMKHHPFGWITSKKTDNYVFIGYVGELNSCVCISFTTCEGECYSAEMLFENYKFVDGTPFGMCDD